MANSVDQTTWQGKALNDVKIGRLNYRNDSQKDPE